MTQDLQVERDEQKQNKPGGNAAGALVEALTAGTPMLHLTGQIESDYLDRDLGFIHEAPAQLAMLRSVSKAAFRIRNSETALATLREAHRIAFTAPCGPVSIEIPWDVMNLDMSHALKLALEHERESESYFRFQAERVPNTELGNLFAELAEIEWKHKTDLQAEYNAAASPDSFLLDI